MEEAARPQPCPQSLGELEPAGLRQGRVTLATRLRALDGLPPVRPWDWMVGDDGHFDRDETGTYVLVRARPRPPRVG